jgi:hypothetical protein
MKKTLPKDQIARNIASIYRSNSRKKKVAFCLSNELVEKIIFSNCVYCLSGPSSRWSSVAYEQTLYTGIDRLIPSLGYVEGNVVPCCKMCNGAKNQATTEEFLNWIKCASINSPYCYDRMREWGVNSLFSSGWH